MQTRNSHDFSVVQFDILLSEDITKGQLHDGTWGSSTTHNSKVFPMLVSDSLTAGARVAARDFFVSYWNSAAASTRSICAMQRKLSLHTTIRKRSFHLSKSTWPRETNPVILAFDTTGNSPRNGCIACYWRDFGQTSTGNVGGDVLPKLHCCNDFSLAVQHLRWGTSLLCLMGFWRTWCGCHVSHVREMEKWTSWNSCLTSKNMLPVTHPCCFEWLNATLMTSFCCLNGWLHRYLSNSHTFRGLQP